MPEPFDSVLMIGYGGPEKMDDVRPFLDNVLRGKHVPPERVEEVVGHYERVGGKSPFNELTFRQAAALEARLSETGTPLPVRVGTRNWTPRLADTLAALARDGRRRTVGVIMAPHQCQTSFEQYQKNVAEAREQVGPAAPRVDYIDPWFDDPGYIEAVADRITTCFGRIPEWDRPKTELIFSAHSIPQRMADASPYVEQLTTSARRVAERLGHGRWSLAYQSRSGRPEDPWLEPDVCDVLTKRAAQGLPLAVVVPIGFLCDHVEVMYDLDIEARDKARASGLTMFRAGTVSDHPKFIEVLAGRVRALVETA